MLLQQKESLEVQCNGIWSHCYDTRHGGMKSPISGNIARRVQWEIPVTMGGRPHRMRRASASFCSSTTPSLQQQLSPTGSDTGHHLRSRGQIWLPSSLLGTTAEDEAYPSRTRLADPQPARTSRDIPPNRCDVEKPKEEIKSPPCRSQTIRKKRLSVEEKLIEDNKAYYKLEMKNSKLRSSGYFPSQRDFEFTIKEEIKEEEVELSVKCNGEQGHKEKEKDKEREKEIKIRVEESVPVRRVRKSELTILSDEAESFMFGEPARRDSSTESSEEEEEEEVKGKEKEDVVKNKTKNMRKENMNDESHTKKLNDNKKVGGNVVKVKIEAEGGYQCNMLQCDESSVGSIDTCSIASSCDTNSASRQKRKRRTHAEAFIHDNLDYYKFEIPGSRLRFQGSILPVTPLESKPVGRMTNNSRGTKATCNGAHSKVITCSNEASNEKEKLVQSPSENKEKTVGENESKSVKKQDKDEDKKKEEKDESNVRENVENELSLTMERLHFSFEVVPQSEPWYQTYTRQDEGEEFYAYSYMSDACYWKSFLLPYEMPMPEVSSVGNAGSVAGASGFVRRRRNRFAHLLDKKPRKSPRCHASTLAILSSLMHHRRRKDPDKNKDETPKSETSGGNSTEDEGASQDVQNQFTASSSEGSQISEPDPPPPPPPLPPPPPPPLPPAPMQTTTVPNSDFKSESDNDLHEIARNIDKMFGMGSDCELSVSENDGSGDETKQETATHHKTIETKNRKTGKKNAQQNKKGSGVKVKKVEMESTKQHEIFEIDPAAMEELNADPPPIVAATNNSEIRCRGGPKMDVVTLIEEFSRCRCMEESSVTHREAGACFNPSFFLGEVSCNSSECGASSTCETVNFSDGPEGRHFHIRGRKRKRKKNLTGWPAEKQKGKKKQLSKVNRVDENVPVNDDISEKCTNVDKSKSQSREESNRYNNDGAKDAVEDLERDGDKGNDRIVTCKEDCAGKGDKSDKSESSVHEKHTGLSRTDSVDSSGGHGSSDYQPCVRVTKMTPDLSSSYYVAGISNNRRLRSSSLSSSPPSHSVPLPRKYPSLSTDGLRRRASPRKSLSRASLQWSPWTARKRR